MTIICELCVSDHGINVSVTLLARGVDKRGTYGYGPSASASADAPPRLLVRRPHIPALVHLPRHPAPDLLLKSPPPPPPCRTASPAPPRPLPIGITWGGGKRRLREVDFHFVPASCLTFCRYQILFVTRTIE